MRGYLYNKISLKEQKEWNFIAEEGRYFINQKIIFLESYLRYTVLVTYLVDGTIIQMEKSLFFE